MKKQKTKSKEGSQKESTPIKFSPMNTNAHQQLAEFDEPEIYDDI